jgi:hypothetical protein
MVHSSALSLTSLLCCPRRFDDRTSAMGSSPSAPGTASIEGSSQRQSSSSSNTNSFSPKALLPFRARRAGESGSSSHEGATRDASRWPLCDVRLGLVDYSAWTGVSVDNGVAARAISLYLETDHPLLGFFDADLFLTDLKSGDQNFCSPCLVSSLLAWACVSASIFSLLLSYLV